MTTTAKLLAALLGKLAPETEVCIAPNGAFLHDGAGTVLTSDLRRAEHVDGNAAPGEWPHKMSPSEYLARFPDKPDAGLARRILEGDDTTEGGTNERV